jgi:hypothetical protein
VKKNRKDLKTLCESIMEIIPIIQDQVVTHGNTTALELKDLCGEFQGWVQSLTLVILSTYFCFVQCFSGCPCGRSGIAE